ncbi:MAG: superoxide dismutase [Cu-Zn] SodC [Alphaproteobacteria bacterium]|nr:superoxide dismutase [Cu-Zn] SodC [Alphaproteobacteria bacterium]
MRKLSVLVFAAVVAATGTAWGASLHVKFTLVNSSGLGQDIGFVVFDDTPKGLLIRPNLHSLTEGQHGFHVHQNPDCGPADRDGTMVPGLAAGGHFDPQNTGKHEGPTGEGHLGDLPVLYVDAKGRATRRSWAPRLKTSDLKGRAIVIHAGGDNYSDVPKKLGGGGARMACGVVVLN